jgi:hypothetical protein
MPADPKPPTEAAAPPFSVQQRLVVRRLIVEVRRSRELLGMTLPLNPRPPTDAEIRDLERAVEGGRDAQ